MAERPALPEDGLPLSFWRQLIEYLGGDPDYIDGPQFGWPQFGARYPHLRKRLQAYFQTEATGNQRMGLADRMLSYFGSPVGWARMMIETADSGAKGEWAVKLVGKSAVEGSDGVAEFEADRAWARGIIETATSGDPAHAALRLHAGNGSTRAWAEGVIEKASIGSPASVARLMVLLHGSMDGWAEDVIANAKSGDPSWAAVEMVRGGRSERQWAEGVIEADNVGDCDQAADRMVDECGSRRDWADRVKRRR